MSSNQAFWQNYARWEIACRDELRTQGYAEVDIYRAELDENGSVAWHNPGGINIQRDLVTPWAKSPYYTD